ncbi:redoxin domain-containing protein [Patescibacteria group bacterium]|nr:redoxin domain-containing protein [Patescibacteria group bacterium]MBU1721288.1 redoxin domain-containing protein [Patescibacteria group bacterium]MBU1901004.1 redoxin domain-containing protein [Patescibacteria group bacterium]
MQENICTPKTIINSPLPDMGLEIYHNNEIKKVNLADYKGKWLVLFFYPADFTFVCPTELVEVANNYATLQELNVEVLSVSTDTAFVHKAWHDNSPSIAQVHYPMAADPTGKLCRALGTYIEEEGLSYRATVIVDPEGQIKTYEIHDNNIGRSAEELLRKIQAAQFVNTHGGQVCPASWKPGKETLTPGIELIGKI